MVEVGFHASHEQLAPATLLDVVVAAEQAGFDAAMCSDHLAPWSTSQGHSGSAWPWLGAALQATERLPVGVFHAPGQRYHPVISAQMMATLAGMFPGRFRWAALGSGEAMNEHVTGDPWPTKAERTARLGECVEVMRALWAGEQVTHVGRVTVHEARLWSLPAEPPQLVAGAISPETAAWAAGWADGLITTNQPHDPLQRVIGAYRDAGGRGPVRVQVHLSYAADDDTALGLAVEQWRANLLPTSLNWELQHPEQFDAASRHTPASAVAEAVRVSSDLEQHAAWLAEYVELGADELFLHHVGLQQDEFVEAFGSKVLPQLR